MKHKNIIIWFLGLILLILINTELWAFTHNWDLIWSIFNDYSLAIWIFNISLNWFLVLALLSWSVVFIKRDV